MRSDARNATSAVVRSSSRRRLGASLIATLAVVTFLASCNSGSKPGGGGPRTSSAGSAAAGGSTGSAVSATGGGSVVDVKNFTFTPMTLTVAVGTKVTWKFEDSAKHTVQAADKSFSSPALSNGQTYSHVFTKAGTYSYICSIHQYMNATIVVK